MNFISRWFVAAVLEEQHAERIDAAKAAVLRELAAIDEARVGKALASVDWDGLGVRRFSSHALRRLAAKTLRQAGVPLEVVAGLLGHSIVMLLKVYREVDEAERFDAMDRARLGEGGEPPWRSIRENVRGG